MFESVAVAPAVPGADAAGWLAGVDPATASRATLIDMLAALQRQHAWHAAVQARVLAALRAGEQAELATTMAADQSPAGMKAVLARQAREWLSEEVGLVLRIPGDYARERMRQAQQLLGRLPEMLRLLENGHATPGQALLLVDAVTGLNDRACAAISDRVLTRAARQTTSQFRRSLHRAVLANTPADTEAAHQDAVADRRVACTPGEHGVGTLWAQLPAPELLRVNALLNGHAHQHLRQHPTTHAATTNAAPTP